MAYNSEMQTPPPRWSCQRNVINALLIQYLSPRVKPCGDKEEEEGGEGGGAAEGNRAKIKCPKITNEFSRFLPRFRVRARRECTSLSLSPTLPFSHLLVFNGKSATHYMRAHERAARFGDFAPIRQWIILHFVLYRVRRTRKLAHRRGPVTLIRKISFLNFNRSQNL